MVRYNFFGISESNSSKKLDKVELRQETKDTFALVNGEISSEAQQEVTTYIREQLLEGVAPHDIIGTALRKANIIDNRVKNIVAIQMEEEDISIVSLQPFYGFTLSGVHITSIEKALLSKPASSGTTYSTNRAERFIDDIELPDNDILLLSNLNIKESVEDETLYNILSDEGLNAQGKSELLINLLKTKDSQNAWVVVLQPQLLDIEIPELPEQVQEQPVYDYSKPVNTADDKKRTWQVFASFAVFTLLMLFFYFQNESHWEGKLDEQKANIYNMDIQLQQEKRKLATSQQEQKKASDKIKGNSFDPYDSQYFRMYGLYRDKSKSMSRTSVGERFNVYNPLAIEYKDVMSERWFVVPVKGVHFVKKGETAESIGKLYYQDAEKYKLIAKFNKYIKAGRFIFIPYDE